MADYVLTDYLEQALAMAVYDKLDDGTFAGGIPPCNGVIAFAASLQAIDFEGPFSGSRHQFMILRSAFRS